MLRKLEFHSFESKYYVESIALITVAVAAIAWYARAVPLAFCAALLGVYVLHLLSMRFMLQVQREQRTIFEEQIEVLQQLMGHIPIAPRATDPGPEAEPEPASDPRPAVEEQPAWMQTASEAAPAAEQGEWASSREPQLVVLSPTSARQPAGPGEATESTFESETDSQDLDRVAVPRHFALGTVAIVRDALSPDDVARILMVQRERPTHRFGELAVELGLLSEADVDALLEAQKRGLFTDAEIRRARERLEEYRRQQAELAASAR